MVPAVGDEMQEDASAFRLDRLTAAVRLAGQAIPVCLVMPGGRSGPATSKRAV